MDMTFTFDKSSMLRRQKAFEEAQKYVDSECIKLMTPWVPVAKPKWRNAGRLRDSVSNPEPGLIEYTAPFAESDYYAEKNHAASGNPNAQRLWFEVMKKTHAKEILAGVCEITGGRPE